MCMPFNAVTAAELIAILQQHPPTAVVTFAYDEYGRNATFGHAVTEFIAVDANDEIFYNTEQLLVCCGEEEMGDNMVPKEEMVDSPPPGGRYVQAVKLFC